MSDETTTTTDRQRFYGKYRGTVLNNIDPMMKGRVNVQVPDVMGITITGWALPCLPFAGIQTGVYYIPPIGSAVWVEFEKGDPDFPICVGGFYGGPQEPPGVTKLVPPGLNFFAINTLAQNTLMISDTPGPTGGFLLKTTTGAMITINDTGIIISNGKGAMIAMVGPTVTINAGALVVT